MLDNSKNERAAPVAAFLNVELFRAMYDRYKGNLPPRRRPSNGKWSNSPKQTERARQTFMESAGADGHRYPRTWCFVLLLLRWLHNGRHPRPWAENLRIIIATAHVTAPRVVCQLTPDNRLTHSP